MKTKMFLFLIGSFLFCLNTQAQEEEKMPKNPMFIVHIDYVKPSMVAEYEKLSKDLVAKLKEHNIQMVNYTTFSDDKMAFHIVTPIESMADLDKNWFKELSEKMGEEAFEKMWEPWGKCYDVHKNEVIGKSNKLSYSPENDPQNDEALIYREWDWYYMLPSKETEGWKIAEEWKNLYASKNIPNGYRVYYGVLGTDDPMLLVSRSAKDQASMQAMKAKENEMLGEEAQVLWQKTLKVMRKVETTNGWLHSDLSYSPKKEKAGTTGSN